MEELQTLIGFSQVSRFIINETLKVNLMEFLMKFRNKKRRLTTLQILIDRFDFSLQYYKIREEKVQG